MKRWISLLPILLFCLNAIGQDFQLLHVFVEEQIVEFAVDELELDAQLATMFNHDVRMYRASYEMPFLGDQIGVSGAVFIPVQENSNVFARFDTFPQMFRYFQL